MKNHENKTSMQKIKFLGSEVVYVKGKC